MKKVFFSLITLVILFTSCQKQDTIIDIITPDQKIVSNFDGDHVITASVAASFAENYLQSISELKSGGKSVKRVKELKLPFNGRKLFVVEFDGSGFVLLSDSKLNIPVLAYSEVDNFSYNKFEGIPFPIQLWLTEAVKLNYEIEKDTALQRTNNVIDRWDTNLPSLKSAENILPGDCTDYYAGHVIETFDEAFTSSKWKQTLPYNSLMGICSSTGQHYPAGCTAIAMGQIMYFYKFPAYFNWDNMYDEYDSVYAPTSPVAELMEELGEYNVLDIFYACGGSGSNGELISQKLHQVYNYSSLYDYSVYTFSKVRAELESGHPVVLDGEQSTGSGHAWIADGIRTEYDNYERVCPSPGGDIIMSHAENFSYYLHMNWGWGDDDGENTWYYSLNIAYPNNRPEHFQVDLHASTYVRPLN